MKRIISMFVAIIATVGMMHASDDQWMNEQYLQSGRQPAQVRQRQAQPVARRSARPASMPRSASNYDEVAAIYGSKTPVMEEVAAPAYPASMQKFYQQRTPEARQARKEVVARQKKRTSIRETRPLRKERLAAYETLPASSLQEQFLYGPKEAITPDMAEAYEQMRSDRDFQPRGSFANKPVAESSSWFNSKALKRRVFNTPRAKEYETLYGGESYTPTELVQAIKSGAYMPRPSAWQRFKNWIGWNNSKQPTIIAEE